MKKNHEILAFEIPKSWLVFKLIYFGISLFWRVLIIPHFFLSQLLPQFNMKNCESILIIFIWILFFFSLLTVCHIRFMGEIASVDFFRKFYIRFQAAIFWLFARQNVVYFVLSFVEMSKSFLLAPPILMLRVTQTMWFW